MTGLINFLKLIYENWTLIAVILGLIVRGVIYFKDFKNRTKEEQIEAVKEQIKNGMLSMVTEAEKNYENWNKAGTIKRSEVIEKIYAQYPILSLVVKQDELTVWIDNEIDNALNTLEQVIARQEDVEEENAG